MFTGIVEEMGRVLSLVKSDDVAMWDGSRGAGWVLTIAAKVVLDGAYEGCSIAVNGTCLTVTQFDDKSFVVGCAPETMRKTNLIDLKAGDPVNLERSMRADARNSGHFVQGHVDGTGSIKEFWREGDSLWVRVAAPASLLRYIVPKGYVAIDGTSLTVCDVAMPPPVAGAGTAAPAPAAAGAAPQEELGWFTFMLIAYTQAHIIVPLKKPGDRVNIEVDLMGKLVERSAATATAALQAAVDSLGQRLEGALATLGARLDGLEGRLRAVELQGRQGAAGGSDAPAR